MKIISKFKNGQVAQSVKNYAGLSDKQSDIYKNQNK